jgi:hypothetical protein
VCKTTPTVDRLLRFPAANGSRALSHRSTKRRTRGSANPVPQHPNQPPVVNGVEEGSDVEIEHPVHALCLPSPARSRSSAARRPNWIRRVLSGCRVSANCANRSPKGGGGAAEGEVQGGDPRRNLRSRATSRSISRQALGSVPTRGAVRFRISIGAPPATYSRTETTTGRMKSGR